VKSVPRGKAIWNANGGFVSVLLTHLFILCFVFCYLANKVVYNKQRCPRGGLKLTRRHLFFNTNQSDPGLWSGYGKWNRGGYRNDLDPKQRPNVIDCPFAGVNYLIKFDENQPTTVW